MIQIYKSYPTESRLFITVWIIYLFHLAPVPAANENRYLDLVRSLVDEGRFAIDTYHHNTLDKSYYDGHYYAGAAPGPAIIAIPFYLIFKGITGLMPAMPFSQYDADQYIRSFLKAGQAPDGFITSYPFGEFVLLHMLLSAFVTGLSTALTAVMAYRCAWHLTRDEYAGLLIAFAISIGSICFFYAVRLYGHNISMFFLFSSFTLIHPWSGRDRLSPLILVLSGLLAGTAVIMDYTAGPITGFLIGYMLWQSPRKNWAFPIAGVLVPTLFMMGYHYVCFGHPFTTPYSLPTDPSGYGSHAEYQAGLGGFSLPGASRVWDLTFGMYRGIFVYTPVLLAALVGLIYRVRQKDRVVWLFILGIFVVQILFTAAMRYWYGGWDFGPRYLVPMIPFVLLGLATEFVLRWKRLLLMLLGISVLINWTGVQYGPSDSIPGVLAMFILSGPTTPLYEFLSHYFKTYTQWDVSISATGAYVMLSILIFAIWRRPRVIPTGPSVE